MKYLVSTIVTCAVVLLYTKAPSDEFIALRDNCKKIREEFRDKLRTINKKAREERKRIREAWRGEERKCWREYKGDIEAIEKCILEKKQIAVKKWDELKTVMIKRYEEVIATIDAYKEKLKECKGRIEEFKRSRGKGAPGEGGF